MRRWFGPKKTGFGYRPVSGMGWLVIALFVGLLIAWKHSGYPSFGLPKFGVPALLFVAIALIAYFTSGPKMAKRRE